MSDQNVVITGAASGIGREAARKFAQQGWSVVAADIADESGRELAEELRRSGAQAEFVHTDVSRDDDVAALVDTAVERFGRLDVMLNNAGGVDRALKARIEAEQDSVVLDGGPEFFDSVMRINQYGIYSGMYHAARAMIVGGSAGTIINMCSVSGLISTPGLFSYSTAKAAAVMMTRAGSLELAPHGIRVVGIAPGGVETPIRDSASYEADYPKHVRGQWIRPEDVASTVMFLAGPASTSINGTVIEVADGYTAFK